MVATRPDDMAMTTPPRLRVPTPSETDEVRADSGVAARNEAR
jgi:hypothetical protein